MKLRTSSTMKLLPLVVMLLLALPVAAQAQLSYTTNNGTITITGGCPGSAGAVIIPDTINGLPVTSIGSGAFAECTSLTSVTIPNSVTSIGDEAFAGCASLTSITIGSSVTDIGWEAFSGCTSLTNITIPNSVTEIGYLAFSGCTGLTAITVDAANPAYSSVDGVWFNKSRTTLIQCPGGKTGAFAIPDSVTSIGDSAFSGCASLTSITIGSGVTSIGWEAFSGCTSLTSVTIPDSVTSIGDSAFSGCTSLTAIIVDAANPFYSSMDGVLFNKSRTTLIQCPGGKTGAFAIPSGITSIEGLAFSGCTGLTSVTIPESVTSIGSRAFENCHSLTSVTLPDSVTSIGWSAFSGCTSLTSVTIPSSVTIIGLWAFNGCTNLTGVYFQGNSPGHDQDPFGDSSPTVYCLPGTTGWGTTFSGRPTAVWSLPNPLILTAGSNLGVQDNSFGFTISWATNRPVVVEASTDLIKPNWSPVSTNTLTDGSSYFSDPQWTNSPARFYRLRSP